MRWRSNSAAVPLEAIREDFDVCLFLGDLVDYGVEPGPCIDWVRKNAIPVLGLNPDQGYEDLMPLKELIGG